MFSGIFAMRLSPRRPTLPMCWPNNRFRCKAGVLRERFGPAMIAAMTSASGPSALPLCFVLMPFGVKADSNGQTVDFDDVYQRAISAGVRDAGMEPI